MKKQISVLLALLMVLSIFAFAAAAEDTEVPVEETPVEDPVEETPVEEVVESAEEPVEAPKRHPQLRRLLLKPPLRRQSQKRLLK
ncbi:hypothetical protein HZB90_01175 [archaeon]|nr:hypothetical protein [archaeon]